jgi:hypothetical protein
MSPTFPSPDRPHRPNDKESGRRQRTATSLSEAEASAIERNLFGGASSIVRSRPEFPWHRDSGSITADRPHSSQALAISVFETIRNVGSKDRILNAWAARWGLSHDSTWRIEPERLLSKSLLGEPRATQVDVSAESDCALMLFECKFTEIDGGCCSQAKPLKRGKFAGARQCDGTYRLQLNIRNNLSAKCALTAKGIRYWDWVPHVLDISATDDHVPCPFKGGWFQWMRNLVACAALADSRPAAVVIVYADGPFPMAAKLRSDEWQDFVRLAANRRVGLHVSSFQELVDLAVQAADQSDDQLLIALREWLNRRITQVADTRARHADLRRGEV